MQLLPYPSVRVKYPPLPPEHARLLVRVSYPGEEYTGITGTDMLGAHIAIAGRTPPHVVVAQTDVSPYILPAIEDDAPVRVLKLVSIKLDIFIATEGKIARHE